MRLEIEKRFPVELGDFTTVELYLAAGSVSSIGITKSTNDEEE